MVATTVTITSAVALSDSQKDTLVKGLKKKMGEVKLVEHIDSNIIGGIKVTVGSKQFDASLAAKLNQLKQSIT